MKLRYEKECARGKHNLGSKALSRFMSVPDCQSRTSRLAACCPVVRVGTLPGLSAKGWPTEALDVIAFYSASMPRLYGNMGSSSLRALARYAAVFVAGSYVRVKIQTGIDSGLTLRIAGDNLESIWSFKERMNLRAVSLKLAAFAFLKGEFILAKIREIT